MNSNPEREIFKNVLKFDVNTEYKTDLITGMNFSGSIYLGLYVIPEPMGYSAKAAVILT